MKNIGIILILAIITTLSSCRETTQQKTQDAVEAIGKDIEDNTKKAGKKIEEGAQKVKTEVQQGVNKSKN